jgi:hypothetical protein
MLKEYLRIFNGFTKTALCGSRICNYLQRYWISGNLGKVFQTVEVRNVYPVSFLSRSRISMTTLHSLG